MTISIIQREELERDRQTINYIGHILSSKGTNYKLNRTDNSILQRERDRPKELRQRSKKKSTDIQAIPDTDTWTYMRPKPTMEFESGAWNLQPPDLISTPETRSALVCSCLHLESGTARAWRQWRHVIRVTDCWPLD